MNLHQLYYRCRPFLWNNLSIIRFQFTFNFLVLWVRYWKKQNQHFYLRNWKLHKERDIKSSSSESIDVQTFKQTNKHTQLFKQTLCNGLHAWEISLHSNSSIWHVWKGFDLTTHAPRHSSRIHNCVCDLFLIVFQNSFVFLRDDALYPSRREFIFSREIDLNADLVW